MGMMTPISLRQVRYALEMSQDALGEYLGYTGPSISCMERGKMQIPRWVELMLNRTLDERIAELG